MFYFIFYPIFRYFLFHILFDVNSILYFTLNSILYPVRNSILCSNSIFYSIFFSLLYPKFVSIFYCSFYIFYILFYSILYWSHVLLYILLVVEDEDENGWVRGQKRLVTEMAGAVGWAAVVEEIRWRWTGAGAGPAPISAAVSAAATGHWRVRGGTVPAMDFARTG